LFGTTQQLTESPLNYGRWLAMKGRRRLARAFYRTLYRDDHPETGRCVLLAGTARSGTTWVGELLAAQRPCRVMFEPFQPHKVAAFRGYEYFHYARPHEDDRELEAYCRRIFSGRIRHPWIDREVACLRPEARLVKEIRANLFLKWIALRFPEVRRLFVLRHPCAVVESRLRLGWATDSDIASFLAQPALVSDFLADKLELIASTTTDEGKHAIVWCISNLVPLRQFASGGLPLVYYEHLCTQPGIELPKVLTAVGFPQTYDARSDRYASPSSTTAAASRVLSGRPSHADWRDRLGAARIDNVLRVVDAFGLGDLYDAAGMPRHVSVLQ
jgi:hypothetical protein